LMWLESVEEDLKEMGVRNWRRTARSWTENSGGQSWKRLRSTKFCNARISRKIVQTFIRFTHAFVCMFKTNWVYYCALYDKGHDGRRLKLIIHFHLRSKCGVVVA